MKKHILTIVVGGLAGILLIAMVGKKILTSPYKISASEQAALITSPEISFSLYDLSIAIKSNNPNIQLIDIRLEDEYAKGHLPNAINVPFNKIFTNEYADIIRGREGLVNVIYSNNEVQSVKILSLLHLNGRFNFKMLSGGYLLAQNHIINNPNPSYLHYSDEQKNYNYKRLMPAGDKSTSDQQSPEEEISIEALAPRGGC